MNTAGQVRGEAHDCSESGQQRLISKAIGWQVFDDVPVAAPSDSTCTTSVQYMIIGRLLKL